MYNLNHITHNRRIKSLTANFTEVSLKPKVLIVAGIVCMLFVSVSAFYKVRVDIDPSFETDVHDYHQDCLEKGGKVDECDAMAILMRKRHDQDVRKAKTSCEAAQYAAFSSCVDRIGDDRLGTGEHYYLATEKAKDMPMCNQIAEEAYSGCNLFGR